MKKFLKVIKSLIASAVITTADVFVYVFLPKIAILGLSPLQIPTNEPEWHRGNDDAKLGKNEFILSMYFENLLRCYTADSIEPGGNQSVVSAGVKKEVIFYRNIVYCDKFNLRLEFTSSFASSNSRWRKPLILPSPVMASCRERIIQRFRDPEILIS